MERKPKSKIAANFNTDWDVEQYKTDYESEEHWELRRRFMEMHKDKFAEDELVCLAQVFTNVEFMGCKYPDKTMRMVAELSQDVAKEFRAKRASKLKRTFVQASDAAEARAKGRRGGTKSQQEGANGDTTEDTERVGLGTGKYEQKYDFFSQLKYGKLVLILSTDRICLEKAAAKSGLLFKQAEQVLPDNKGFKVEISIGGEIIGTAVAPALNQARRLAFAAARDEVQTHCYTIKLNPARDRIKLDKSGNKVVCGVIKEKTPAIADKPLDENNKGYRIMKMMGWVGGGLGKNTQGREEPVSYLLNNGRAGLGASGGKLDRKSLTQILRNYVNSEDIRELQFEAFAKEERAWIHTTAARFNLKSASSGKDDNRVLNISKKNIREETILTEVLLNKNPTYMNNYFVQVPAVKAQEFPFNAAKLEPL